MLKKCNYNTNCGGCQLLDMPYEEQLRCKSNLVKDCFDKYNISNINIPKTIGMFFPYKYRNKAHLAIKSIKGRVIIGFFEENSKRIVDIKDCILHDKWLANVISIVREWIGRYKIKTYEVLTKQGMLRYIICRVVDNNLQITIVATSTNFAGREWLYAQLAKEFNSVSMYININKRTDDLVFDSNGFKFVKGEKYLSSSMLGVKYEYTPNSFLQVNLDICKSMYTKALELLDLSIEDSVLDLYSGIGITSILFAKKCKCVTSIEYNSEATSNAVINKKLNNVDNLQILTGPCGKVLREINITDYNKLFLDPARMGAEQETIDAILQSNIDKIVYMSCDPDTLARDIARLATKYRIEYIQPFDMFPHTKHVETIVSLKKL